jgi:hypothetical protein
VIFISSFFFRSNFYRFFTINQTNKKKERLDKQKQSKQTSKVYDHCLYNLLKKTNKIINEMVNTATSNEQHHLHHEHEHEQHVEQQNLLHHPEPLNDPSGILSNSPNFASVNGIQIFEPIYQPNIAEKNLKVASVTLPNGHKRDFHIHKNSKGNILFDLAAESETLLEKDYFGLRYEDELGEMVRYFTHIHIIHTFTFLDMVISR